MRLITAASDPYRWKYNPDRQHLFTKQISKHNAGAYREISRELGKSIEVVSQSTASPATLHDGEQQSLLERINCLEEQHKDLADLKRHDEFEISNLQAEVCNLKSSLHHSNIKLRQLNALGRKKDAEQATKISDIKRWWDEYYTLQEKVMRAVNDDLMEVINARVQVNREVDLDQCIASI